MFSEGFFSSDIKTRDCMVKGKPVTELCHVLTTLRKKAFEAIVGNRDNAGNHNFLLLLNNVFQSYAKTSFVF